jgi:hypothetical protein
MRKAQERKIWRKGLNTYRNKFRVPDTKTRGRVIGKSAERKNF